MLMNFYHLYLYVLQNKIVLRMWKRFTSNYKHIYLHIILAVVFLFILIGLKMSYDLKFQMIFNYIRIENKFNITCFKSIIFHSLKFSD